MADEEIRRTIRFVVEHFIEECRKGENQSVARELWAGLDTTFSRDGAVE